MKITEFCLATAGLITSFWNETDWLPAVLFGVLAFRTFRRIMLEVEILEEGEDAEGGVEPWASLGYAIQRWRKRK